MTRLRILAMAAGEKMSDAHTCTEGHVVCGGAGNKALWVAIVTATVTPEVNLRSTLSMVSVTLDQSSFGRA